MEENVHKELDTLKNMVTNWKKSYLSWVTGNGGNEYILTEFSEEISTNILPYVCRLRDAKYLTPTETSEFLDQCYAIVDELRKEIEEAECEYTKRIGLLAAPIV